MRRFFKQTEHITGGKPRNYHEIVLTQFCSQAASGTRCCSWGKKGNIPGLGHFLYTCECDDEQACYLIVKMHVNSKTKYVNILFHSSHRFNSPLNLKFRQSTFVI